MFQKPPPKCPVCREAAEFRSVQDYKSEDGRFTLYECPKCEVQFWTPFRNPGPEWYQRFSSYEKRRQQIYFGLAPWHVKFFEINPRFRQGTKLLDIGCGSGEFLYECQARGAEVWGVDFSPHMTRIAQSVFGLRNVFTEPITVFLQRNELPRFDYVTLFEVIEHVDDPFALVRRAAALLKPKGKIFVSTPCRERLLVNLDVCDFPYHHLTRWSPESLQRLLEKVPLVVARVHFTAEWAWLTQPLARHFRFELVRKTESLLSLTPPKPVARREAGKRSFFKQLVVLVVHTGAFVKDFFLVSIPISPLWLWSKVMGIRNGDMLVEAVKKSE